MPKYDHKKIEKKWKKNWKASGIYKTKETADRPKYYILDMFPYPSGAGLHVGHPKGYIATDVIARMKMMQGYNVLHPMGWDAFGLPAENYAIQNKLHPRIATEKNISTFKKQLDLLGFTYDWDREINTTDPEYYKWTQWAFLQMFKAGLAYESYEPINWCPKCLTGLANEDLEDGKCERCGSEIERKPMRQWVLKITKYADRLLEDLDKLKNWPEPIKEMQRNWIGRSEGAEVVFGLGRKYNFVIVHAYGADAKSNFYPWLKNILEKEGHEVAIPNLPDTDNPSEEGQVGYLLENCKFDEKTIVVGHSLGVAVALKAIEKSNQKVAGLVSIGGFVEPKFKDKERPFKNKFDWNFDFAKIKNNVGFVKILSDLNDYAVPREQGKLLAEKLGGELVECEADNPHFLSEKELVIYEHVRPAIKVFTTRPDTLFGATYMVVAPEHKILEQMKEKIKNWSEVEKYIAAAKKKSDLERTDLVKEKTGVRLEGVEAVNPVNGEFLPIFVADYVIMGYGTGAIMAVPAHDERDFEFAKKYRLPIKEVVEPLVINRNGPDAFRDGMKITERTAAVCIVKHWSEDKYMGVRWLKNDWQGFVIGGIEKGEDAGATGIREIAEETGYKNVEFVKNLGGKVHGKFFQAAKQENRFAHFVPAIFKLKDGECVAVAENEKKLHQVVWLTAKEMDGFVNRGDMKIIWGRISGQDCTSGDGLAVNSGFLDGLTTSEAKEKMTKNLEEQGIGVRKVQYKLRDWVFSRQRYWGEPIPLVHCEKCGVVAVSEEDLPVVLPDVKNYEPTGTGESPLANIAKWVNTKCPQCGGPAKRETNTMPQWAGSCWYYLRYIDPHNNKILIDKEKEKYWNPVDFYVGGAEHATRHLIYARFWHKFLYDIGAVHCEEPFTRLQNVGLILAEDGRKMSKRWGNVINPDNVVEQYGADSMRVYEMFMGPFDQPCAWSTSGLIGARRFLEKVWTLQEKVTPPSGVILSGAKDLPSEIADSSATPQNDRVQKLITILHQTIKKVSDDIENMRFNTAIAQMMTLVNEFNKEEKISNSLYSIFIKLLSPFAPHLSEEIWTVLGNKGSIFLSDWPKYDSELTKETEITLAVQVNGKLRETLVVSADIGEEDAKTKVLGSEKVQKWLEGKTPKKVIYVKGRLVSIVI